MGQGGHILISNKTPNTWQQTHIHSYQMNAWDAKFPKTIAPGQSVLVYVEWDQGIFKNSKDDGAEVIYQSQGDTNFQFEIMAKGKNGFCLFFKPINFTKSPGKIQNIGWNHDGIIYLGLVGNQKEMSIVGNNYNLTDWMRYLKDSKSLSEFTIPGTHDSCSLYGGDLVRCQYMDLKDQLQKGIRFLDIRCRHIENVFTIHHGIIYQKINFGDVLNICNEFLKHNPSETIVMSVKHEYNDEKVSRSFEDTFREYLEKNTIPWYLENKIPILEEVRGKIVLLRRFAANTELGINGHGHWKDNDSFSWQIENDQGKSVAVQDAYKVPTVFHISHKWEKVKQLLDKAKTTDEKTLFLNYTSGVSAGAYPYSVAYMGNAINKRLQDYVVGSGNSQYGILAMDFPERPNGALIPILIGSNF